MAKYIKADALIEDFRDLAEANKGTYHEEGFKNAITVVEMQPTADVVERKEGKWEITDAFPHIVYCGVCHKRYAQTQWQVWKDGTLPRNYCPNCGAKMEADDGET